MLGAAWLAAVTSCRVFSGSTLAPTSFGLVAAARRNQSLHAFVRRLGVRCCFCGGFLWAALVAHVKLADNLPEEWEGRDIGVRGVVAELPEVTGRGQRFTFDVEKVITPLARVPHHISLQLVRGEKRRATGADARRPALGSCRAPASTPWSGQP